MVGAATEQKNTRPSYFLLESYILKNGSQAQRLASYFQLARIGMAQRLQTVAPAFVLEALVAAHMPQVLAISAFTSIEEVAGMKRKLREDGKVHIHACGTAGKIWGAGELGDFVDIVDDIVGIAEYIVRCEEADVVQVL